VVHELDWFPPSRMTEQDNGLDLAPFEAEYDLGANPFGGGSRIVPTDKIGLGCNNVEVMAPEFECFAGTGSTMCLRTPPATNSVDGRDCAEDFVGLCRDSDTVGLRGNLCSVVR
jgi:hypothetical protein